MPTTVSHLYPRISVVLKVGGNEVNTQRWFKSAAEKPLMDMRGIPEFRRDLEKRESHCDMRNSVLVMLLSRVHHKKITQVKTYYEILRGPCGGGIDSSILDEVEGKGGFTGSMGRAHFQPGSVIVEPAGRPSVRVHLE